MTLTRIFSLALTFFFATNIVGDYGNIQEACKALQAALPGRIYFPESEAFEQSVDSYAYVNTRLRPTCIVGPKSAEDVSKAIKVLVQHPAVQFAVRSGGHNTNKGFANTDNGITIDLAALSTVTVNEEKNTVSIGVGARWTKVYDTVERHGRLSVQGGRVGSVGTGGYITGGGIGYFSPDKGWACDSVKNFDVILANGTLVCATATSHPDLFKALKGGSNNFGIVTSFDLETIEQGNLTGGTIVYGNGTGEKVLDAVTSFKRPENFDKYAMLLVFLSYNVDDHAFLYSTSFYHARSEKFKGSTSEVFAKVEPQILSDVRNATAGFFANQVIFSPSQDPNVSVHWSHIHFRITPTILHRMNTHFRRYAVAMAPKYRSTGFVISLVLQSVPAYKPGNSLGFDPASHPEKDLVNLLVMFTYTKSNVEGALGKEIKTLTREFEDIARKEGALSKYIYLNYAASWQEVFEGYGKESVEELKKVARRYDPEGVFQRQVRGGFKLSRVHF